MVCTPDFKYGWLVLNIRTRRFWFLVLTIVNILITVLLHISGKLTVITDYFKAQNSYGHMSFKETIREIYKSGIGLIRRYCVHEFFVLALESLFKHNVEDLQEMVVELTQDLRKSVTLVPL